MTPPAAALLLLALVALPGAAAWLAFGPTLRSPSRFQPGVSPAEHVFLILFGGVIFASWPALLLAEFGRFSLARLLALSGVFSLALLAVAWRRGLLNPAGLRPLAPRMNRAAPLAAGALLGLLLAGLYGPPSAYLVGGRDHGLYVNTGVHIARSGAILIHDETLALAPPESRPLLVNTAVDTYRSGLPGPWSEGQRLSGLTIRDLDRGTVAPHAFHLYAVWFAIFYAAGGLATLLWPTPIFALLGLAAVGLVAGRLYGRSAAAAALLLLASNLIQVWFTGYPTAEILLQPLFWGGVLATILWLQTGSRYAAFLAGAGFGLTHLTKLDTVFIPVFLIGFFVARWLAGRRQPGSPFFWLPYGLLLLHTALHAWFVATIYFIDQSVRVLLPGFLSSRLATAAAGRTDPLEILAAFLRDSGPLLLGRLLPFLAGVAALFWLRREIRRRWGRLAAPPPMIPVLLAAGLVAGGVGLALLAGTPLAQAGSRVITQLGWYLTPAVLALGLAGAAWRLTRVDTAEEGFTIGLVLLNVAPFFVLGMGTAPDHFWAIRRFVTVFTPAVMLYAAVVLVNLPRSWPAPGWLRALFPLGMAALLALVFWRAAWPANQVVEYQGLDEQLAALAAASGPGDVMLLELTRSGIEFATPLWLIFDRPAYTIDAERKGDPGLSAAVAAWRADGRRVFWLGERGTRDIALPGLAAVYRDTHLLGGPRMEEITGGVPRRVEQAATTYDIFELLPEEEAGSLRPVDTVFTAFGNDRFLIEGLYPPEENGQSFPRRWTAGEAVFQVDLAAPPLEIMLLAANPRPPGVPAPKVIVLVDGVEIGRFRPEATPQIFRFDPAAAGPAAAFELRLETTPWVPRDTGHSLDERPLGFDLSWIKVIGEN